jgi:hypothetical protein
MTDSSKPRFATVSTVRTGAKVEFSLNAFHWIFQRTEPEPKTDIPVPHAPLVPSPTIRLVSLLQEACRKELLRLAEVQQLVESKNSHSPQSPVFSAKLNARRCAIILSYRNLIHDAKIKLQSKASLPLNEQHKLASDGIARIATFFPWTHTISSSSLSVTLEDSQHNFLLRIDQDALIFEPVQIQRSVACCPAKNKFVEQLLKERCRRTLSTPNTPSSSYPSTPTSSFPHTPSTFSS